MKRNSPALMSLTDTFQALLGDNLVRVYSFFQLLQNLLLLSLCLLHLLDHLHFKYLHCIFVFLGHFKSTNQSSLSYDLLFLHSIDFIKESFLLHEVGIWLSTLNQSFALCGTLQIRYLLILDYCFVVF